MVVMAVNHGSGGKVWAMKLIVAYVAWVFLARIIYMGGGAYNTGRCVEG